MVCVEFINETCLELTEKSLKHFRMARDRPALAEDTQPVCQGFEASPANKAARPGGNLTHEVKQAAIFPAGGKPARYLRERTRVEK